jgi:hypothetical protein
MFNMIDTCQNVIDLDMMDVEGSGIKLHDFLCWVRCRKNKIYYLMLWILNYMHLVKGDFISF